MSVKLIIDSHGVPCGMIRRGEIESWSNRLDEALALPVIRRFSQKNKDTIVDGVHSGRPDSLEDRLETIQLKGFYMVEREIQREVSNSTIDERSQEQPA